MRRKQKGRQQNEQDAVERMRGLMRELIQKILMLIK